MVSEGKMIKIFYKENEKDIKELYRNWFRRNMQGSIVRVRLLCGFILCMYLVKKCVVPYFFILKYMASNVIHLFAWIFFFIFLYMFFLIFTCEYKRAKMYWKTNLMIKEMGCFIETISFYEEYAEIEGYVLHKKVVHKLSYSEEKNIYIYKKGIVFSDGKNQLFISEKLFNKEDYAIVSNWIRSNKK